MDVARTERTIRNGVHTKASTRAVRDRRAALAAVDLMEVAARLLAQKSDGTDLTSTQWLALRFFADASARNTIGEFAEFFRVSPSSASQTISRLRQRDLVAYERPPEDRRRCEVVVTDAGRKLLKSDPAASVAELLLTLDRDQFDGLVAGLTALIVTDSEMFD
ncbi:MarR family winged helix-turn-helix transcriptional regulator [Pyruvatibacter sp. HU-CL02332]|uniref:MarR family winged helix-turn-helix transcriptional regulator n=1 Tax=Pyruvatibacter sp. HU-CL02332 TaxID=3127650 RepID=UPI0029693BA4|nr:MarR family transcriptional regulator [Alphaproteobacteria bacterium]